jgi:anti-anti-sigma factor
VAPIESKAVTVLTRGQVSFAGLDADRTIVWLTGEHDVSTVAAVSESLARAIALDDADLVVDLSGVEFMGAALLNVILRAHAFLRLRSRSLTLRSPSPSAQRVIDVCVLHDLLQHHDINPKHRPADAGALGTWVAVPTEDRAEPPAGRGTSLAPAVRLVERVPAISREGP